MYFAYDTWCSDEFEGIPYFEKHEKNPGFFFSKWKTWHFLKRAFIISGNLAFSNNDIQIESEKQIVINKVQST